MAVEAAIQNKLIKIGNFRLIFIDRQVLERGTRDSCTRLLHITVNEGNISLKPYECDHQFS